MCLRFIVIVIISCYCCILISVIVNVTHFNRKSSILLLIVLSYTFGALKNLGENRVSLNHSNPDIAVVKIKFVCML